MTEPRQVDRLEKPEPRARTPRGRQVTTDAALRGRRNKRYGQKRQGDVRRFFEHLTATQARWHGRKANEETWSHLPIRLEVKAGMQCGPTATAYLKQEKQGEQARAVGDVRPFVGVSAPEGMSDFLITIRGTKFVETLNALGFYQVDQA